MILSSMSPRRLASSALVFAACVAVLVAVDGWSRSARIVADGRFDHAFFQGYTPHSERWESRLGYRHSILALSGLRSGSRVEVELRLRARRGTLPLRVFANGTLAHEGPLEDRWTPVRIEGIADGAGTLDLTFRGGGVRVASADVSMLAPGSLPLARLGGFGLLVALGGLVGWWAASRVAASAVGAVLVTVVFGSLLSHARCHALAALPHLILALAAVPAASWLVARCGLPSPASRWVGAALVLKLALVSQPAFPSIDGAFHAHNVDSWRAGEPITSRAPGVAQNVKVDVPYPPALYAALAPLAALDPGAGGSWVDNRPRAVLWVRVAQALLEGLSPLLVFLLGRALGGSTGASGAAAVAAALVPESLLVLGKGIAANTLGMFATLLAVVAAARRLHPVPLCALMLLSFTSHFGAAMLLVALLGAHALHAHIRRGSTLASLAPQLWAAAVALGLAWLLYYRVAFRLTGGDLGDFGSVAVEDPGAFFGIRGYRIGKTLQDLLLKFGGLPLGLAALAIVRKRVPAAASAWLVPWTAVGLAAGLAAILTPVPLRFEYFLMPVVALAAGFGAELLEEQGRRRLVSGCWAILFAGQLALGTALLLGRVRLISVIMESPRWPFPFV